MVIHIYIFWPFCLYSNRTITGSNGKLAYSEKVPIGKNNWPSWNDLNSGENSENKVYNKINETRYFFLRCCKTHDTCYFIIHHIKDCETLLMYRIFTTEYEWSYREGEIICSKSNEKLYSLLAFILKTVNTRKETRVVWFLEMNTTFVNIFQ